MAFGSNLNQITCLFDKTILPIEFSSGIAYNKNNIDTFLAFSGKKIIHNYFPAPKEPFVLNLASVNKEIRQKSISHCINGLKISVQGRASFYCAHAGFLIDPNITELGTKIEIAADVKTKDQRRLFINSIKQIVQVADELGIDFYIENNVLAAFNYNADKIPFYCCESKDIIAVFKEINHPRLGLLLDTAHLKVSCKTLGLNLEEEFHKIKHLVKAIHHSDNNGLVDSNDKLEDDYWFLKHLHQFNTIDHVIEVKDLTINDIHSQIELLNKNFNT